jgi:hypothetical protein
MRKKLILMPMNPMKMMRARHNMKDLKNVTFKKLKSSLKNKKYMKYLN